MTIPFRRYWALLVAYLRPQWALALLMAALLLGSTALQLLGPQVLRRFLDAATTGGELRTLVAASLLFLGVTLATQVLSVADTYVAERVGWTATNALRADLALHCLRLDPSFHNARTPGELVERIDGDVNALANFFSRFVINVAGNVILLAGVLVLLWREDWRIGLSNALFAAVIFGAMLRMYAFARPTWVAVEQASALFFGYLQEHLSGTEDIRASGAVPHVLRRCSEHLRHWAPLVVKGTYAEQAVWVVALSLFAFAQAVALATSAARVQAGSVTIGTVYLVYQYVRLLIRPISQLQSEVRQLQEAGASIVRVEELFQTTSRGTDPAADARPLPGGPLAVTFDHVSFAYAEADERRRTKDESGAVGGDSSSVFRPSSPPALHDISFDLQPGAVLGVVGRTGSGKSTLARLLLRFYDPQAGAVRCGGVDLRHARLDDLRRRVGMVTQEVQLFHATVRDNLTFFDHTITDDRLFRAGEELGLLSWLTALPQGLETPLASGAGGLSAGEAQLLAFMRVFLRDAGLVILDEASSRLDPATDVLVEGAVDRLLGRGEPGQGDQPSARTRTGIVIAHRLSTVQRADDVLVLEDGRVAEYGRRESLLADDGSRFASLLRAGQAGRAGRAGLAGPLEHEGVVA